MNVATDVPLRDHTTLHIGGPARYFSVVSTIDEIREAIQFAKTKNLPILILGGGSNMLVSDQGFDRVVIKPRLLGFTIEGETVTIAAGENWDECAARIVEAGLWGIENLSFVPGSAAGLAVQNVGAYGQEASDVIESVEVFDTKLNSEARIMNNECRFGYRSSIFNTTEKGRYVILSITLKLSKTGKPNTSYGVVADSLPGMREAIITVRKSKGQDTSEFWSAGSFFKNPIVSEEQYAKLGSDVPRYPAAHGVKVPAGYLLDKICNLKGLTVGGAQLSERQVINIINLGSATAHDVLSLFQKARQIVHATTGITLVNEPELIGFSEGELEKYLKL